MTIAVLLTCYNRKDKTIHCLENLFSQDVGLEFFLVDDGSTDGTRKVVAQQFPQVNIIQGTGDLFWNRGMHLAWTTATKHKDYDFYLWMNDDTNVYSGAIRELLETSESENHRSIISGPSHASDNPDWITYGGTNKQEKVIKPNGQKQECVLVNGNILLVPRYVYSVVGLNDPFFHHSTGDYDYGLRARKLGIRSFITPHVLGVCDWSKTINYSNTWWHSDTPLTKRFKILYSPLGNNPILAFVYKRRHFGLMRACILFLKLHLRAFFPVLYGKLVGKKY